MSVNQNHLPFEVGQEAESKSFMNGYRSAWFRCKIKDIRGKKGNIRYFLQFFDFPDEKITWTQLYQKPLRYSKSHDDNKLELMVRPTFPPYFRESARPDSYPAADVVAIVEDDWEVGDLVDWWSDGCFWSGRVTQILGNDTVEIKLPDPPIGEGKVYEAYCKDLRPSLNWTPQHGWTVPISREYGGSQYCARLVQPLKQDEETEGDALVRNSTDEETEGDALVRNSTEGNDIAAHLKSDGVAEENYSCEPSTPRAERKDESVAPRSLSKAGRYASSNFQAKLHSRQSKYMASRRHSDTVESAVMELEEVANKIRWLKGLLQFGFGWSNAMKPSWKILENSGQHVHRV